VLRQLSREPILALGIALAVVPPGLMHFLASEQVAWGGVAHALFVTAAAGAATAAAIVMTLAAARRNDGRSVMIGTAFSVMAALLVLHGVSTPDVIFHDYGVVALSGAATIPAGGALLALCTIPALRSPRAVRPLLALQAALLTSIAALGAIGLFFPNTVPAVPQPRSTAAWIALAVGLAFYGLVGWRAFRTYRLTRRGTDMLVVVGTLWLASALVAALLLTYLDLGWWIGHGLEVLGIAAIAAPVALDLRRPAESRPLLGDLSPCSLVAQEEAFLGAQVGALTRLLATRDTYTEEHTRRVALRSVQVGEELGLPPERLRILAAGGLLHDMGKLSVPDEILKKPGSLTEAEYELVKRHSEWGEQLLANLGFPGDVRRLVRDHHERLDGSGYPFGVYGEQLDLETRIIGACDVYDALISPRVYRGAWTHERALDFLREHAGTAFDAGVVHALATVLEGERPQLAIAV
jgi:HD-GYP domain-containing protein (c-di-GMP phosphodiesterase class II)